MNMDTNEKTGLGDPAITPSVSGSNLAQSGEDFLLPPIAPAHNPEQQAANAIVWIDAPMDKCRSW